MVLEGRVENAFDLSLKLSFDPEFFLHGLIINFMGFWGGPKTPKPLVESI